MGKTFDYVVNFWFGPRGSRKKDAYGNLDPKTKEITIEFSEALNGHNTGVDFGELGQDAFPKGTLSERKWSADNKSWTIPVELEPNKVYQIFISNNFRTQESIPLKPYLIEFKTVNK